MKDLEDYFTCYGKIITSRILTDAHTGGTRGTRAPLLMLVGVYDF